jgi:hypothetical protein
MAIGPLAHGYLAFKLNATQTLLAEEETHEEKPVAKMKLDLKDHYISFSSFHRHVTDDLLKLSHHHYLIFLSKGYVGTPFLPPDMI